MKSLEILDRLISFPTVSTDSNLAIIDYIQDYLVARGFKVHRLLDQTGLKAGLFARIGPSDKAGVMVSGHTDVVPITDQIWTKGAFNMAVENDKAYGRGTTDMKGYLACVLALADKASNTDLNEPLKISFSYDEEIGCTGIKSMIDKLDGTIGLPRGCFVGEPTSMQVAIGHKGKVALHATCYGMSGHSAMAPKFLNALHLASEFVLELRKLQDHYALNGVQDNDYGVPYSTIHVGKMSGGMALNIVPDKADVNFEFRHLAKHNAEDILKRIQTAAEHVTTAQQGEFPSAKIEIEKLNSYPPLDVDAGDEFVKYAQYLTQVKDTTKVSYGTEAGYFCEHLGIPTVVCGPGSMDEQGHKPDEYIELSQLSACDTMFDRLLDDIVI